MEYVEIAGLTVRYSDKMLSQPIPSSFASPSDIRFREDLVWARRNDEKRSKVFMGLMRDQKEADLKGKRLKGSKAKADSAAGGTDDQGDDMVINVQEGTHLGRSNASGS